jgi:hypothetical protein
MSSRIPVAQQLPCSSDSQRAIVDSIVRIEDSLLRNPETLEIVVSELHGLLNKLDPSVRERKAAVWPIVPASFDPDEVLRRIREETKMPRLKVTDIRFKADQLAKRKKIPLPKGTMNHKEPLMQWYKVHWDELVEDLRQWHVVDGPGCGTEKRT